MVAFEGIDARAVDVLVQVAPGLPAFKCAGLPEIGINPPFTTLARAASRPLALNKIARFQVPNGCWDHATKIDS
jgi:hypothetical protein